MPQQDSANGESPAQPSIVKGLGLLNPNAALNVARQFAHRSDSYGMVTVAEFLLALLFLFGSFRGQGASAAKWTKLDLEALHEAAPC